MNPSIASPQSTKREWPFRGKGDKPLPQTVQKALLVCGIMAALWYIGMDILVSWLYPGYSSFSQTVSELSAIGAPTRQLWNKLGIVFTLLEIAFGWGVWQSAGGNRALRIVGGLLITYGIVGAFWPPMHPREVLAAGGKTMTDTLHIVFTMVTGLLMMLAMGFAAAAFEKRFRFYSIATILLLLAFGTITGLDAPQLEANQPTPWMGVWERVNIYATMLWMIVLAVVLLRSESSLAGKRQ